MKQLFRALIAQVFKSEMYSFFPTQITVRNQTFPPLPYQNLALLPMKERKVTVVLVLLNCACRC